jgi:thiol:disulfide interchange protein DsbD
LLFSCAFAKAAAIPHGTVELISAEQSIAKGQPLTVGLDFHLEPGWHVYWKNPGDSGQPPRVQWELPAGLKAGTIQWPVPKRLPVGPLVDYGYEDHVLLPIPFEVGGEPAQKTVDVKAHLRVLVCRETCIPGKADLALTLPVTAAKPAPSHRDLFAAAEKQMPVPLPSGWRLTSADRGKTIELTLRGANTASGTAEFFPATRDIVENAAPQHANSAGPQTLQLTLKKAPDAVTVPALEGLLLLPGAPATAYEVNVPVSREAGTEPAPPPASASNSGGIATSILFAFVGGLILNLMPCVFPVLSIKVLSLVGNKEGTSAKTSSLVYTLGILVSFWILVGVLLALRSAGLHLGWGFQLQSPAFVAVLICFLFVFGLNLAGVFEFGQSFMGVGSGLAARSGYSGSFFTGVLATVVATPCTAPFMGTAIAFALAQPAVVCFAVFTSMALGLSLPFLLIAYIPVLARWLPKPGRWMETLKHLMAFPVFATVIWLLWVLGLQASVDGLVRLLISLLVLALAAWMWGHWSQSRTVAVLSLLLAACAFAYGVRTPASGITSGSRPVAHSGRLGWEPFTPEKLASYRSARQPVLVDFTAAWCLTCQVNEKVAFGDKQVQDRLVRGNIALLRADWTSYDPAITKTLTDYGRSGVPVYVLYAPGSDAPVFLPDGVFGPSTVVHVLDSLRL